MDVQPIRSFRIILLAAMIVFVGCQDEDNSDTSRVQCMSGSYPNQSTSPYILPYETGQTFCVGQGNCSEGSHAPGTLTQYAYDFLMPIGTMILAAHLGQVLLLEERFEDGSGINGQENYINIQHPDGTIAAYVHLTKTGALVSLNETVKQGQLIGLSGNSRNSSEAHLHFHVQACNGCMTIPITFQNTRAHPNGLMQGGCYTSE
jgi:murein DD-endopeptidase MepM/ murein hydrolase activator NlpD